jgi:diguanylate cyclase (GGDEF)-like protein
MADDGGMRSLGDARLGRALGLHQTAEEVYPQIDWARAVRVGGALWIFGAVVAGALLPFKPPTKIIGDAGWVLTLSVALAGLVVGAAMIVRPLSVKPPLLLAMGYAAAVSLGVIQLLVGGNVVLTLLLVLVAPYHAALHPPRRVIPLIALLMVIIVGDGVAQTPHALHAVEGVTAASVLLFMAVMALLYARMTRGLAAALDSQRGTAESLARTDPLTGLGNRRAFTESLPHHIGLARRYGRPLSLLMLDVDRFKSINDDFGHDAGDDALRAVARVLAGEMRDPDLSFRWGGDEFAVLLPETSAAGAEVVAARFVEAAARHEALPDGQGLAITAGIAECLAADLPADLMARADADLFERKRGRPEAAPAG